MSELESLLRSARALEPRSTPRADETAIARAVLAGRARHARWLRSRRFAGALALAALAAAAVLAARAPREPAPPAEIVELSLPTGDRLAATGDARFAVVSSEASLRRVALARGAVLFDVAPLGAGAFEVSTPDATVVVRGTVFVVEVADEGTSVRVFEGRVEVHEAAGTVVLEAGEAHRSERATPRTSSLEPRARLAARRREVVAIDAPAAPVGVPAARVEIEDRAYGAPPEAPALAPPRRARRAPEAPAESADAVRALVRSDRADEALARAERMPGAEWRMIEADALRRLGRDADAARAYERAAAEGDPAVARPASYLAAELRLRRLGDPAGALAALDAGRAEAEGSPLRERALVLRADALDRLGRSDELAEVARAYLAAFADGPRAEWMRARAR